MISKKITDLRKQKGLTQVEIAEQLKISRQAYSFYELGKNEMDFKSLCKLADFYNVSTDYLLGRYDVKPFLLSDDEEIEIIRKYRTLDQRGKNTIKANLDFEMTQSNYHKETVIK